MERPGAILWARLALRINRPDPKNDHLLGVEEAATTLGTTKDWQEGVDAFAEKRAPHFRGE